MLDIERRRSTRSDWSSEPGEGCASERGVSEWRRRYGARAGAHGTCRSRHHCAASSEHAEVTSPQGESSTRRPCPCSTRTVCCYRGARCSADSCTVSNARLGATLGTTLALRQLQACIASFTTQAVLDMPDTLGQSTSWQVLPCKPKTSERSASFSMRSSGAPSINECRSCHREILHPAHLERARENMLRCVL